MSFLDSLFYKPPVTGYLLDNEEWIHALPRHELFSGGDGKPVDWSVYAPKFRYQQSTLMCTAFAGCNLASMLNSRETGQEVLFSPIDLFNRAHGGIYGNTIQDTVKAMQEAVMPESVCPWTFNIDRWDYTILSLLDAYAGASVNGKMDQGKQYAVKQATLVSTTANAMQQALAVSPLLAIVNVSKGYFDNPAPPASSGSLHAVVITNVADDGKVKIFDSLTNSNSFDGFHWLAPGFPILYAFGVMDLPNDWENTQKANMQDKFSLVLARYGKPVDWKLEQKATVSLLDAKQFNPTCASYLVANWQICINAVAYGGYSVQDILNQATSIRRGKGIIFDLNQQRMK